MFRSCYNEGMTINRIEGKGGGDAVVECEGKVNAKHVK
jgi:hypothetical protein